jgi:ribosomal-protein-alanine N-acetyltransferase
VPLIIDRMRAHDLDEVLAIERASFGMPWSRGAFLYEMQQNRVARCWVMREGRGVVGYICLWEIADEVHVTNVAVHPSHRRQGIARALLGGVIDDGRARKLRMVVLEVRPSNRDALTLYESFGFRVVGRRRGYYYDTGEDALIMETTLNGGTPTRPDASREPIGRGRR